ncbi:MAG: hypothetical protein KME17_23795 [Cyanosarcina radialis HA8281-LM2]|jgi:hypothetical protein|nr:hypothetical protein [Cyanosarcina radialis HA8281-LM2]
MPNDQILTINSIESAQTILEEVTQLRWQQAILDAKLAELNPLAVDAALLIVGSGQAANGKQIAYRNERAEIVLSFRSNCPKDQPELETLKELIEIEREKATRLNAKSIAAFQQQIATLEAQLVDLMTTEEGDRLIMEYEDLRRSFTCQQPILSVKLK